MTDRWRIGANASTAGNAAAGVAAILYVLAGNKLWAMLLIAIGVGLDGLDGILSRKSRVPSALSGRVADSVADAIAFGMAPAVLLIVHTSATPVWQPYERAAFVVGVLLGVLAVGRLLYFTWRGFRRPYFWGAPTPQSAVAVIVLILLGDTPGFLGELPLLVLLGALLVAVAMVLPIPFPKVRRSPGVRAVSAVTGAALAVALVPLQFRPAAGSPWFALAESATWIAAAGVLAYYFWGPSAVPRPDASPTGV